MIRAARELAGFTVVCVGVAVFALGVKLMRL